MQTFLFLISEKVEIVSHLHLALLAVILCLTVIIMLY